MRGDTRDQPVGGLLESAVTDLVADALQQAGDAVTAVDAQGLVTRLRGLPGVRAARVARAGTAADLEDHVLRLPVGAAQWRHELRVDFADDATYHGAAPMAREVAAAVDRALSLPCRPVQLPSWGSVPPLYEALTAGARAVIVVVDPARGWAAISDSITEVLGYDRHAPPDVRLIDLVHPDDRPAAVETFLHCCGGSSSGGPVDLRVRTAAGRWRTLEVAARSFVHDREVGVVAFYGVDVTGEREAGQAIHLQRGRLATLVETMRDGLLVLDDGGRVGLVNAAALRLLGLGDPAGAGERASGFEHDWDGVVTALRDRLHDGAAVLARLRGDVLRDQAVFGEEIHFRDGRVLELDFAPIRSDGASYGTLVHVRDVTSRVAVRRGLEERSRGLEERNRALIEAAALNNEFVATVAHELRGPLSSVVAFAHLLGEDPSGQLEVEQRTYVDVIDRNANRLLRLIEDLLLLSRLESRTLRLRPTPTRLPELLLAAVAERTPAAAATEIELSCDVVDGSELICDDTRIHQVVDNLVSNAVKFTPSGGRVTVRGRPSAEGWTVEVADTGVGIPAADLPRLFSAFFRGANVASAVGRQVMPGTGLGLVVSRAIVELHGGTIQVASTEGVGTAVTLFLPMRPSRNGG